MSHLFYLSNLIINFPFNITSKELIDYLTIHYIKH